MKTTFFTLLLTVSGCLFISQSTQAQANARLLYAEGSVLGGSGNGINYGGGVGARYHHPIRTNLALTSTGFSTARSTRAAAPTAFPWGSLSMAPSP